jgi:hypothetical protein
MLRSSKVLVASLILGWTLMGWAETPLRQYPQLTVFVTDSAGAAEHLIADAERGAARVFHQAGVDVAWVNCGMRAERPSDSRCDAPIMAADLVVRIVPRARTLPQRIFGVSFLANGRGVYADVFLDHIRQLREVDKQASLAAILGDVIAHELGHLLLGSNAHSREGIMQAHWEPEQVHRIATGQMLFTAEQAMRMRSRVASLQKKESDLANARGCEPLGKL